MKKAISEFFKMVLIFLAGKLKKFTMRFKKTKTMKDYMMVYYSQAKSARLTGKKVAWITSGGPVGPLIAMNVIPVYWENQGRYFNVPLFILDTPFCHTEYTEEMGRYVRAQFDEYFVFLEKACGRKFDFDKLKEVGPLSHQGQL